MKTFSLISLALILAWSSLHADEAKPTAPAAAQAVVKDVTPEEAEKLLKANPKVIVLDVRTPEEFAKGHIAGAKNVDFQGEDFSGKVAKVDPQTPILLHCAAGGRSTQALESLKDKQVIYHLKDGFKGWEKAGKAVER